MEPVTSVVKSGTPVSWKEKVHAVADRAQPGSVDVHAQYRVGARADAARDVRGCAGKIVGRREHAPRHRFVALIGESELERWEFLRVWRLVAHDRIQHDHVLATAV